MRSATTVFDLASSLAWRGICRGSDGVADLVEAVQLYDMISSSEQEQRFGAYRALALFNSTICMQSLPTREAKKAAANLLLRAVEAIGDAITAGIRDELSKKTAELEAELKPAPLRWRDPATLASASPDATARIRALEPRYEGSFREVGAKLLDRGLSVPFAEHLNPDRLIVAQPRVQVIKVAAV